MTSYCFIISDSAVLQQQVIVAAAMLVGLFVYTLQTNTVS